MSSIIFFIKSVFSFLYFFLLSNLLLSLGWLYVMTTFVDHMGSMRIKSAYYLLIFMWLVTGCALCSCSKSSSDAVDRLNEKSYASHYRNLDSTSYYAIKAYKMSADYPEGKAEALNNVAFVSIAHMDYAQAYKLLEEAGNITDNQVELLVTDVQLMRLCQRQSKNKEFYDFHQKALTRLHRIEEEQDMLNPHQKKRMIYARSEYAIVTSTYFYYVGLTEPSRQALMSDSYDGIEQDTAQMMNYYYNIGAGGIIHQGTSEDISQAEFDNLMRCYMLAYKGDYPYWIANSMQAISEHLQSPKMREFLISSNLPAMKYINVYMMPDSLLAGNLAQRSLEIFTHYGDVYQIAGAYRTLAESYWSLADYRSALICLQNALNKNKAINLAPDLVASIREQLSLVYSAMDDKPNSDNNRNVYLDMQEMTRQDRQLEARAEQLNKSSAQLNYWIAAVIFMIPLVSGLLFLFGYMRRRNDTRFPMEKLLEPLESWKRENERRTALADDHYNEVMEAYEISKMHLQGSKRRNLEQRVKMSLVVSITPLIDRMMNEVRRLSAHNERPEVRKERYEYISELTDKINEYNSVLTRCIQMRQGELSLHIESFPLQSLFDMVMKSRMSFQLKGLTLDVEPTTDVVKADKTLTLFMMNTLADNARKFTQSGGVVKIYSRQTSDYVEISVSDNGEGLTEDQQLHLFEHKPLMEKRSTIDNESFVTSLRGNGFGLLNCKGIIEKYHKISSIFHVSIIAAESRKGEGSRFYFRLPKGIVKVALLFVLCTAASLKGGAYPVSEKISGKISGKVPGKIDNVILTEAGRYADSAYFSNINGHYARTLLFADTCRSFLNKFYLRMHPNGKSRMVRISTSSSVPAEQQWLHENLPTNYNIILDIRNESAVAALALHDWSLYQYNNTVYTQLFREISADNTLSTYVKVMQRSESNKNVAVIVLILLLVSVFPAYYLLYYRYQIYYRFCIDKINGINAILLKDIPAEEKLSRINKIWGDGIRQYVSAAHSALNSVVGQIKDALQQSIESESSRQLNLEMAEDELHRTQYEHANLHVSNNILDNCLSTLKHETMYYPSRIRQLIDGSDDHLASIQELLDYYKQLYTILSAQGLRQIRGNIRMNDHMLQYLFEILRKNGGGPNFTRTVSDLDAEYLLIRVPMPGLHLSRRQCEELFTFSSVNIQFLLCRQIVREIGESTNARRCGIQAVQDEQGQTRLEIIIIKNKIWTSLK